MDTTCGRTTTSTPPPTPKRIFVEKVSNLCVKHYDKKLYNTNNYGEKRPENYTARSILCNTSKWMDNVGRSAEKFTIPKHHVKWMRSSYEMARRLRDFPYHMYGEDMDELLKELGPSFDKILKKKVEEWVMGGEDRSADAFPGFFIRGETVSLKDGVHGVGPYKSLKAIIESICTASYQHSVLAPAPADSPDVYPELPLFLFPWVDDLVHPLELRVFVSSRVVTGISQQQLYNAEPIWQKAPLSQIEALAKKVVAHFEDVVTNIVDNQDTFTYDLGFRCPGGFKREDGESPSAFEDIAIKRSTPYFIESNPFGAEYPAGSSLFDWRYDKDRLDNQRGDVFIRFTVDDETEVY